MKVCPIFLFVDLKKNTHWFQTKKQNSATISRTRRKRSARRMRVKTDLVSPALLRSPLRFRFSHKTLPHAWSASVPASRMFSVCAPAPQKNEEEEGYQQCSDKDCAGDSDRFPDGREAKKIKIAPRKVPEVVQPIKKGAGRHVSRTKDFPHGAGKRSREVDDNGKFNLISLCRTSRKEDTDSGYSAAPGFI